MTFSRHSVPSTCVRMKTETPSRSTSRWSRKETRSCRGRTQVCELTSRSTPRRTMTTTSRRTTATQTSRTTMTMTRASKLPLRTSSTTRSSRTTRMMRMKRRTMMTRKTGMKNTIRQMTGRMSHSSRMKTPRTRETQRQSSSCTCVRRAA